MSNIIIKNIIIIIFLLESRFFYLIPMPKIISKFNNYSNKFIIFLVIIITVFSIIVSTKKMYKIKQFKFNRIMVLFIVMFISEIILSYINYHQGFKNILMSSYYFLIILFYYILMFYIKKIGSIGFIKKVIISFSLILSIIFIIQSIKYNAGGVYFLKTTVFDMKDLPFRNGNIRLTFASTLISLGIILSFSEVLKGKKIIEGNNLLNVVSFFFSSYYLLFVCQTRILIICEVISIIIMILFKAQNNFLKKSLILMLTVLAIAYISNLNTTQMFFASFNDPVNKVSNMYRLEALNYYIQIIKENMFFGMGFVRPLEGTDAFTLVHGYQGYLYTTDVGIVGLVSIFGLLGASWFIGIIIKLFYMLLRLKKYKDAVYYIELIGIITFLIFTSATIIVTDPQRIILLPVIMVIFEYYYLKYTPQNYGQ